MSEARVCQSCRRLVSAADDKCAFCGQPLGGRKASKKRVVGQESRAPFSAPLAATKFLIGLSVVDFAMLVLMNGGLPLGLFGPRASNEAIVGAGGLAGRLAEIQPWRLLSANFVHLHLLHLGVNMYALLSFGRSFEERFNGPRLIVTYALTGICGFWLSSWWYGPFGPTTAGASASLFGLIGVEIAYLVSRRDPLAKEVFIQYLFMAVALALIFPVNNFAHLGGFIGGLPLGYALSRERRSKTKEQMMNWGAVAVTALSVLSICLSLATLLALRQQATGN